MHTQATYTTAQHFIQSFSWMLLHSLWQGLLLALLTGLVFTLARRSAAAVRYNLVLVQLLLFITACGTTFAWEWFKLPEQSILRSGSDGNAVLVFNWTSESISHLGNICISYFTANAPMIVLLWFVLFIIRSVRMMTGLVYIHRARHRHVFQPSDEWKEKVDLLCRKLQLKKAVSLFESGYVKMPMVIGHLTPVILVPFGLIASLPAGQVEAVLLHELAHIRRHDYLVNFIQTIAETVFFFNPSLLWISSLLREERENCCDDIALAQTQNKKEFVQALISFKEHAMYGASYQVAFPGRKNHLLNRVSRILNNKNKGFGPGEKVFLLAGIIFLSVIVTTATVAQVQTLAHVVRHNIHTITSTAIRKNTDNTIQNTIRRAEYSHDRKTHASSIRKSHNVQFTLAVPVQPNNASAEIIQKKVEAYQSMAEKSEADRKTKEVNRDIQQAINDQLQAGRDMEQARLDQLQAKKDQDQARRDQMQARLDEQQAQKDQEQALLQAKLDKERELADQLQARKNQENVVKNKASVQE